MDFGENLGNIPLEKNPANKKRKIIIANVDIEDQARDMAEEKMTSSQEKLKGFGGFIKKIWTHNLAREYYRQKEIVRARREIQQSGKPENLYAGEKGEKSDHDEAMKAIVERFAMEYEEDETLRAGEEKKLLKNENPEEKNAKNILQDLVKRYATGSIDETQFNLEKNDFFRNNLGSVKGEKGGSLVKKGSLYADNLLEIAKQIKNDIEHGMRIDALDLDFDIIIGKAKAGVETQAQYNAVDRITEKIQKSFVGGFVNEATLSLAVAAVYGVGIKGTMSAAQRAAKWVGPVGLGLSAGIGGAVAGIKENKRLKEERAQHIREMAKGKKIEKGSKRREEMEKFRYETKNAADLTGDLEKSLKSLMESPDKDKLEKVLADITEIDSRVAFSKSEKIDMISFSDSKKVEQERTKMFKSTGEAKEYLKKNADQSGAEKYKDEAGLKECLSKMKKEKIKNDFEKNRELKDKAFNKMKRGKIAWAVARGVLIGTAVGVAAQEVMAVAGNSHEGIFNSSGTNNAGQIHHFTSLEYLRRYFSGELPQADGRQLHGAISQYVQELGHEVKVGTNDYVKNHEDLFSKIKRGYWADNDTLKPDKNELKLWWGGEHNTGINSDGKYVFNVKNMVPGNSAHGGANFNPQELIKEGKLKLLVSLSSDTQNQVVEIPIDIDGNAIIDPNSEIGKLAFQNIDGHAKFIGKFAEVAAIGENKDGIDYVDILATHKGEGVDNVSEIIKDKVSDIQTEVLDKPVDYDVEWPYAIPLPKIARKSLEELGKKPEAEVQQPEKKEGEEWKQIDLFKDYLEAINAVEAAEIAKAKEAKTLEERQKSLKKIAAIEYILGRTAAEHTLYRVGNFYDLNAATLDEGNKKFFEVTKKLWTEFTTHEKPDLDANACSFLWKLAGFDTSKLNYVEKGEGAESGIVYDTSGKDGVVAEKDGKILTFDHHGKKSDRSTASAKFVYETLVELGFLDKEKNLDKFIEFVTKCDNMNFTPAEMKKVYKNYSKNLYGLSFRMKAEDVLELLKNGTDPMKDLSVDYLKNHKYLDPRNGGEYKPLAELAAHMKEQMENGKEGLKNVESEGFVADTGDDRFGKILIDTKKKANKNKYYNRVDGDNKSNQLEVFLKGYGGYLVWSPNEDSFVLYTRRKMDDMSLPGGFSQGFNMRGNMWTKSYKPPEKLTITLGEIFSKLAGKNFKIEGSLANALEVDSKSKEMLDLLDDGKFTEDILRKTAIDSNVPLKKLLTGMMVQRVNIEGKIFDKIKKISYADAKNEDIKNKIAINFFLEYQKNNNSKREKEKQKNISSSVKKLSGQFSNLELSYDAIKKEAEVLGVKPSDLAVQFIKSNKELKAQFEARVGSIDEKNEKEVEKLAVIIILENESNTVEKKVKEKDQEIAAETNVEKKQELEKEKDNLIGKLGDFGEQLIPLEIF
jgi:hypothetical protein